MANELALADHLRTTLRPQDRFKPRASIVASGTIYFLAGAGHIKIGITTGLTSRVRAIRNSLPVPLELLAIMPEANNFVEARLHDRFRALRCHGEWFADDGSIREHIVELIQSGKAKRP